jgi:hypothetical protein
VKTRKSNPRRPQKPSDGPQAIGYASPPQAYQFKPGQSGDTRGRPKGSKSEATILREILNEKVDIGRGGKKRVTVLEAMLRGFAEKGLKGDIKSAGLVLNRNAATQREDNQSDDLGDNLEAIADFVRRFKATKPRKR